MSSAIDTNNSKEDSKLAESSDSDGSSLSAGSFVKGSGGGGEDGTGESSPNMPRFEQVCMNSSQAVLVTDASAMILWVSAKAQIMFGWLDSELVGQNVDVLMPDVLSRSHSRLVARFNESWRRTGAHPTSQFVDARVARETRALRRTRSGVEQFSVRVSLHSLHDTISVDPYEQQAPPPFYVAYVDDISMEHQLRFQLAIAEVVEAKSSEGIVVSDLDGQIKSMNAKAEEMFGIPCSFALQRSANVKWLMPESIARHHDMYMRKFKGSLSSTSLDSSGAMQKTMVTHSSIVSKSRVLTGNRIVNGVEEQFPIMLRVELVGDSLVAYIRDMEDMITREEFTQAVAEKLFPPAVKYTMEREPGTPGFSGYSVLQNISVLVADIAEFSEWTNLRDPGAVYGTMNELFIDFDGAILGFGGEIVKRTGDGVIAVFGLPHTLSAPSKRSSVSSSSSRKESRHDNDEDRRDVDFAIMAGSSIQDVAIKQGVELRIGIATGEVGSGIFGRAFARQQWDVWGQPVNLASRLETLCDPGGCFISADAFSNVSSPAVAEVFQPREVDPKGFGLIVAHHTESDWISPSWNSLSRRIRAQLDQERAQLAERKQALASLQQERASLSGNSRLGPAARPSSVSASARRGGRPGADESIDDHNNSPSRLPPPNFLAAHWPRSERRRSCGPFWD